MLDGDEVLSGSGWEEQGGSIFCHLALPSKRSRGLERGSIIISEALSCHYRS